VPVAARSAAASPAHPAPLHGPATAALTRLLMAGLSPDVARRISAHVGPDFPHAQVEPWLQQVLAANLRAEPGIDALIDQGGAIALVGPTGVGKTTTVAKLAARCAVKYGAAQLALVTLDAYRIGAHEQLRTYGQILGVPVHVAHDAATLRDVLQVLRGRRVVLIDTCGLSQRDPRLGAVLGMLDAAGTPERPVRRVLLVQAAAHAETLDEVARAWQAGQAHGAIMTKLDEAARIGGALDCLLRWKLPLVGLTNGQRVPEDWHAASTPLLAHIALKPAGGSFALQPGELTGEKTGERAAA
jgi:flagellar biosynthesis protein FlhF